MAGDLELPQELYGFGSLLLWVLATRATEIVDLCYADGPARPSPHYGSVDGHPVPTPSLVAWLLTAAEHGLPVTALARRNPSLSGRQHVLRTIMSRVLRGRADLFENRWLSDLALICRLGDAELELLATSRDEAGLPVDPEALRRAIARTLRSRPVPGAPASGAAATRALPRDIASFTGREPELRQLLAAIDDPPAGRVVGIHAIGGMAGVGKTALAVHAAHQLASRFPDGQIFLPLHGHVPGQSPVGPEDALARLLQISGITAGNIPRGLEARAALWRDHLAGKKVLLLLDDAAGHEQVRSLLPGTPGSLVIITSRRHLAALEDSRSISLGTLRPDEAARLFVRLAGRRGLDPGDADVGQITRLCGYLPLAIGMLARRLHHHPVWTAADLAADLATAHDRLDLMHAEDLSVAAAFDLSYQDLAEGERRLFRRLGLHPGDDIDAYAAAALADIDLAAARRHLEALYDQHLITEPVRGRYRLHDLIREHARALAAFDPQADRGPARQRLLDYYQHAAGMTEELLARQPRTTPAAAAAARPAAVPGMPDRQRALAWARSERANLLACLDHAAGTGQHARVIALTAAMAALLRHDGPWTDAITRHAAAARAARHLGNRLGEASALHEQGAIRRLSGDYQVAAEAQQTALGIYRDLGNRLGEANALHEQGAIGYLIGDYRAATAAQEMALDIYRHLGDGLGQADALLYLGAVRYQAGDYAAAAAVFEAALGIYRDHGHQRGQANTLQQLGAARRLSGDYEGAAEVLEAALGICQHLGYRAGEANALHYLGATLRLSGDYQGAAGALETALKIYRDIGDPGGEAEALNEIGTLYRIRGILDQAEASHRESLELARELDSRWDEAHALAGLGRCAQAAGRSADARAYLQQAREIFLQISPDEVAGIAAELDALITGT